MYVNPSMYAQFSSFPSFFLKRHRRNRRGIPRGGHTRQRSKAVSWLPLILIIREHDSSIWVSSSQSSRRLTHPILLLSLMDVETGEMKIPAPGYILPLDFLQERWIGPEQRAEQCKSVSVDCVQSGLVVLT